MILFYHAQHPGWVQAAMIGLRLAVIVLYLTKLLGAAPCRAGMPLRERLHRAALSTLCIGLALLSSPPQLAALIDHPFPPAVVNVMIIVACTLFCTASILWSAARGLTEGGSPRDVRRGAAVNVGLVLACIVAARVFA